MKNKLPLLAAGILILVSCGQKEEKESTDNNDKDKPKVEVEDTSKTVNEIPEPLLGESAYFVMGSTDHTKMVEFYKILGWEEQMTGEEPWKWTALSDGSTMLMINEDTMSYFAPGYYSSKGQEVFEKLAALNIPEMMRFPNPEDESTDWFRVYNSPDSMSFTVTNSPSESSDLKHAGAMWADPINTKLEFPNPVVGMFQELALTVESLDESMAFWEELGFHTHGVEQSMYRYTHMYDGLLVLGLHETKGMWHGFTFTYSGHGVEENEAALKALQEAGYAEGIKAMEFQGQSLPGNFLIPDPAGNMFMLTTDLTMFKK